MAKGRRIVVFGVDFMHDLYAVARMRVPYRPKVDYEDGMDCHSPTDVFTLYWRYTTPNEMAYTSTTTRKLQSGKSHADKVLFSLQERKATHLVLNSDTKTPDWFKPVLDGCKSLGIEVLRLPLVRVIPEGINKEKVGFLELQAWKLVFAYLRTLSWPQIGLEVFAAAGTGKDTNARAVQKERVTRVGADHARKPTEAELDAIRQGKDPMIILAGVRLSKMGERAMYAAIADWESSPQHPAWLAREERKKRGAQ